MEKRSGTLVYDPHSGRMDIRFGLDSYYGGLHCGQGLDVLINGRWIETSIEKAQDWYLVGIQTRDLVGLRVRIST